jgi:hypothetical protein
MNMPGFTAEASLYRTSAHYHLVTNLGQAEGGIHPAQFGSLVGPFVPGRCRHHFEPNRSCFWLNEQWVCINLGIRYLGYWCD